MGFEEPQRRVPPQPQRAAWPLSDGAAQRPPSREYHLSPTSTKPYCRPFKRRATPSSLSDQADGQAERSAKRPRRIISTEGERGFGSTGHGHAHWLDSGPVPEQCPEPAPAAEDLPARPSDPAHPS